MNEHKRFNLILAFVFAFSLLGMPAPASAQEPSPYIQANPAGNWVRVYDWPVGGSSLTLTINDGNPFYATAGQDPWSDSQTQAYFDLNGFDLKAGDSLKVTDGITELTYTPTNLALTGFDLAADTISGIGAPGVEVQVCLNTTNYCIWNSVTPASDGTWTASFSGVGDEDLVAGSNGQLIQPMQGNHTFVYWQIPGIAAYPTRNWVQVVNWPVESELTLTINNGNPFTKVWQDPGNRDPHDPYSVYFVDLGGYDLKAGDLIKVTDDSTPFNEITLTVGNLAQTGFDLAAGTISGIGTPGVEVWVMANTPDNCPNQYVPPDSDGTFTVSFNDVCGGDLAPGGNGWLNQPSQGGSTSSDWGIPFIEANLTGNWVSVYGWPVGMSLTLTINNVSTFQATVGPDLQNNGLTTFDLGDFDLKAYDNLKLTDGAIPANELTTTTTNLSFTGFDLAEDTITGTGAPGVEVGVCLNIPDNCIWNSATPDPDGNWTIKFTGVGDEDLVAGSNGMLYQNNQGGHLTSVNWEISNIVPNRPPQITTISVPVIPILMGESVSATATFTDPDVNDTHSALWDWGDGLSSPGTVTEGNQSIAGNHTYTTAGVYTVKVTITDAAGAFSDLSYQYVVIYDPGAGFVTGGGWINSPAGAYTADPSLTGKATFGFVSRYQKGANVPTGNTEFQFKLAILNFSSTSYDWLVVAGAKAQYKGTGTINGAGSYGFMVTAIDGQINGGGGVDKFRIKIWDKATGQVIYDNQSGASDVADPTTAIQGGSIVIHK